MRQWRRQSANLFPPASQRLREQASKRGTIHADNGATTYLVNLQYCRRHMSVAGRREGAWLCPHARGTTPNSALERRQPNKNVWEFIPRGVPLGASSWYPSAGIRRL